MKNYTVKNRIVKNRIVALAVAALAITVVPALPAAAAEPGDVDWFFVSATDRNDIVTYQDRFSIDINTEGHLFLVCDATNLGEEPGLWEDGVWTVGDLDPFRFGRPTYSDVPICGDWNGDGIDTVGVVRGNKFFLASRNQAGGGTVTSFTVGRDNDIPLVGDWDGDGIDTIALRRGDNNYFFTSANRSGGGTVVRSSFGQADDLPVAGDWDGNGTDTLALRRGNTFHITNQAAGIPALTANRTLSIGRASDAPISANLEGEAAHRLGLIRVAQQ